MHGFLFPLQQSVPNTAFGLMALIRTLGRDGRLIKEMKGEIQLSKPRGSRKYSFEETVCMYEEESEKN